MRLILPLIIIFSLFNLSWKIPAEFRHSKTQERINCSFTFEINNQSTIDNQPSTINNQSTIDNQQSKINSQSTINNQQSTINNDTTPAAKKEFNRDDYYKAMEGNNKQLVIDELNALKTAPSDIKEAFTGAMIMKRAGMGGSASFKLRTFKEGHKMLESAIKQHPDNVEFRFLRLIVQEHAPGILGYKDDIQKDSEFIQKSYKTLAPDVQVVIETYSKKSKLLKLGVS